MVESDLHPQNFASGFVLRDPVAVHGQRGQGPSQVPHPRRRVAPFAHAEGGQVVLAIRAEAIGATRRRIGLFPAPLRRTGPVIPVLPDGWVRKPLLHNLSTTENELVMH